MAVRLFSDSRSARRSALLWAGVTLFLTVYTSWLGIFAAAAMALVAAGLWRRQPESNWWWPIVVAGASAMAALMFTTWRYLRVVDASTLITYYTSRFMVQGTPGASGGMLDDLRELLINYRIGYLPLILLLTWLLIDRLRYGGTPRPSRQVLALIVLSGLPVLLDHLVFMHYARHDFAALKAGPLCCAMAGLGLAPWPARRAWLAVTVTALMGIAYFLRLNPWPGHDDGRYAQERDLGLTIAATSHPEQAIFFRGHTPEPQVCWYAKRTIVRIDSLPQAREFLLRQGTREGVVFELVNGRLLHRVVTAP
jgi:hypothetical protein